MADANNADPGGRRHITEFDVMRGAAIIAVVYLHSWFSSWPETPNSQLVAIHIFHLFGHTAVPSFLFIAAFLQARDRTDSFVSFQRKKAVRIYLPLFTWMGLALLYRIWQEGWSNDLLKQLALFNIAGQFYYLLVLSIFFAAFFFARSWSTRQLGLLAAVSFVVSLGAIAFYEHGREMAGDYAILAYRNPLIWVAFYAFGFWLGRLPDGLDQARRYSPFVAVAMLAIFATYLWMGEVRDDYPASYFGVTVFLFSCCAVVVYPAAIHQMLRVRAGEVVTAPFRVLAPFAFAIYLVHIPFFVGWVTTHTVSDSNVQDNYWRLMHALFIVGFLTSLEFVILVTWFAPRLASLFLGVEVTKRRRASAAPPGEDQAPSAMLASRRWWFAGRKQPARR